MNQTTFKVFGVDGRQIGVFDADTLQILDLKSRPRYDYRDGKLISIKSGSVYGIASDGQIVDSNGKQKGYIQDYKIFSSGPSTNVQTDITTSRPDSYTSSEPDNSTPKPIKSTNTVSLASQLKSLASYVNSLEELMDEYDSISARIKTPVKTEQISRGRAMKPFLIPGFILCGFSLIFLGSKSTLGMFALFLIIGLVLIGIGYFASNGRIERSAIAAQAKYDADLKEQNELNARLGELESRKAKLIDGIQQTMIYDGAEIGIPDSYFYSDAISFFADRINSGRSNTLSEAMDAYDEHIHRLKLEQAAFEAAEYQRQSANNLAAIQRDNAAIRRQGAINTALHVANTLRHWD